MAGIAPQSDYECPVCHEEFSEPKILPCAHLMCKGCVVSWLKAEGQGGCPLCRAHILPAPGPLRRDKQKKTSIADQVNNLPTDLATMALVESKKALDGDDACSKCGVDAAVMSFCLQCCVKLCEACAEDHKNGSATRDHVLEDLKTLTVERLATSHGSSCIRHHEPNVGYCCTHNQAVCPSCMTSDHNKCSLKNLGEKASEARTTLTNQARRLREKEAVLATKINELKKEVGDAQAHFTSMRDEVNALCDQLQTAVERKRSELNDAIERQENAFLSPIQREKSFLEEQRAGLAAHAHTTEHLLDISSDETLLDMLKGLTARLDNLETLARPPHRGKRCAAWTVSLDEEMASHLEQCVADIGHVLPDLQSTLLSPDASDTCYYCGNRLDEGMHCTYCGFPVLDYDPGTSYALDETTTLKVGDVVRSMSGISEKLGRGQPGRVIHVGQGTGYKGAGWVLVRWKASGRAKWQRHGAGGWNRREVELWQ